MLKYIDDDKLTAIIRSLRDRERNSPHGVDVDIIIACNALLKLIDESPEAKPEPRWIPVTERLPEEHKWIGTKRFGTTISDEVYVTIEVPSGDRIVKHLCFQNGAIPSYKQRELDAFYKGGKPIAWRPLPEPYKEETE